MPEPDVEAVEQETDEQVRMRLRPGWGGPSSNPGANADGRPAKSVEPGRLKAKNRGAPATRRTCWTMCTQARVVAIRQSGDIRAITRQPIPAAKRAARERVGRCVPGAAPSATSPRAYSTVARARGMMTAGAKLHADQTPSGRASCRVARQRVKRSTGALISAAMDWLPDSTARRLPSAMEQSLSGETRRLNMHLPSASVTATTPAASQVLTVRSVLAASARRRASCIHGAGMVNGAEGPICASRNCSMDRGGHQPASRTERRRSGR
jgi:hypothetical protein